jgi:SAM-dependent methyltransferase
LTDTKSPFDILAPDYDDQFDASLLGSLMRRAVRRRLDARFAPGDRLLELNCGTGEDAVYLGTRGVRVFATDASQGMVDVACRKVERAGLVDFVQVGRRSIEDVAEGALPDIRPFDGLLSNFGGLNCVTDLIAVARGLADQVRPGGIAVVCLMGPLVPWEWGWFLLRGQPATALRRLKPGGVAWRDIRVRYPTIRAVRRAFSPGFRLRRAAALGALLPPTYVESWASKHRRFVQWLDSLERKVEAAPFLPWLADHYVLELERVRY